MLDTNLKSEPQNHYVQLFDFGIKLVLINSFCFPFLTPVGTSIELEEPK